MVQSMTGFATAQLTLNPAPGITIPATMTIKSLNGKFFEVICRMPSLLAPIEQTIIQHCKEALKRGSITVTIQVSNMTSLLTTVRPSMALAKAYVATIQEVQKACNVGGEITISDLIKLPNLFETVESPLSANFFTELTFACDKLLTELVAGRTREGAALQKDLEETLKIISASVEELAPRAAIISHERRERFLKDISAALATVSEETKNQHVQALYQHVNTIDTHEEIVRLRAHCETFLATLRSSENPKGKKLDFILQELFREINTLCAKLADLNSMAPALTLKTKLEQAREQVQNIV